MYLVTYLIFILRPPTDRARRAASFEPTFETRRQREHFHFSSFFFRFPPKKSTSDHTIRDMNPGPLGPNQTPRAAQWGLMMKLGGGFAGI